MGRLFIFFITTISRSIAKELIISAGAVITTAVLGVAVGFSRYTVYKYTFHIISILALKKQTKQKKAEIRTLVLFIPGRESLVGEGRVPQVNLNIIHVLRRVFHSQSDPTFGPICHKVGSRIWAYPNKHAFMCVEKTYPSFEFEKGCTLFTL